MKFNQISVVDKILITEDGKDKLQSYSKTKIKFPSDDPTSISETISRIGPGEVALVSLRTTLNDEVFRCTPNLECIIVCSTSKKAIDITAASRHNIYVKNVSDYCNEATAEFVISNILNVSRRRNQEVYGKTLGVIGCGAVGKIVIEYGLALGMTVYYNSASRNIEVQKKGAEFLSLIELLHASDIISLHTPRDLKILWENEFQAIGDNKIIINTAVGKVMSESGFMTWICHKGNLAIFDAVTGERYRNSETPGIIVSDNVAGYTEEAKERMTQKILENLNDYLSQAKV